MSEKWWETVEAGETSGIIPTVYYIIRCRQCKEEFSISCLLDVPNECPDCGARNEVNA